MTTHQIDFFYKAQENRKLIEAVLDRLQQKAIVDVRLERFAIGVPNGAALFPNCDLVAQAIRIDIVPLMESALRVAIQRETEAAAAMRDELAELNAAFFQARNAPPFKEKTCHED